MLVKAARDGNWQYPRNRETNFFEAWQGVAHDEDYWYSSNANCPHPCDSHLWATPVETGYGADDATMGVCRAADDKVACCQSYCENDEECGIGCMLQEFKQGSTYVDNPWSSGWDHVGDMTLIPAGGVGNGLMVSRLVAPLESNSGNAPAVGALYAENLRAGAVSHVTVDELPENPECPQTSLSWIGYNPQDGLLYTSPNADVTCLSAYHMIWNGQLELNKTVRLRTWAGLHIRVLTSCITGGDFSDSGKLYLVVGSDPGGILVVDTATGVVLEGHDIEYEKDGPGKDEDELEGITVWDLTNNRAPGMTGQVHVGMLDVDWAGLDQLYFKHYNASFPAEL
jgi:hypothetical protein